MGPLIACSLNEVEGQARRAARGSGMPWGLAEEAGKAARWLAARGLPGTALVARLVMLNDGHPHEAMAPEIAPGPWHAPGGLLCPVRTGTAISDRASSLTALMPLTLGATACPLLLAPFMSQAAALTGLVFELRYGEARLTVDARGLASSAGAAATLGAERVGGVKITVGNGAAHGLTGAGAAVMVEEDDWARLAAYAHRTYVPASDLSRTRGAGSGLSDND